MPEPPVSAPVAETAALAPTKPAAGAESENALGASVSTFTVAPLVYVTELPTLSSTT